MTKSLSVLALLWSFLPLRQVAFGQTAPGAVWYLTGRVILEDGVPPGDRVDIETICNGQSYVAAHTDSRGFFSFRLGAAGNRTLQDASVGLADGSFGRPVTATGPPPQAASQTTSDTQQQTSTTDSQQTAPAPGPRGINDRSFRNCELSAWLPGFRSETISLASRRIMDNPNIGTIILYRLAFVEGRTVSVTTLAAPKAARKAYEKGLAELKTNKLADAGASFEKATELYPEYAAAWCELGKLRLRQRQPEEASRSFQAAIQADPRYLDPYLGLSALEAGDRQWRQLADTTGQALRLAPFDYPRAYYWNAVANYNLRDLDAAEKSAREAERLDTRQQFPETWRLLGTILADGRQFAEAAVQLREYLLLAPRAADADGVRARLAEAEKLSAAPAQVQPN